MPKKEFVCDDCGAHFTVSMQQGYDINHCPCCGEILENDNGNELDDE